MVSSLRLGKRFSGPGEAVVADPGFTGLPDEDVLVGAAEAGRALVTANIKDFMPIDARYPARGPWRGQGRPTSTIIL
jgi:hypothetical protein